MNRFLLPFAVLIFYLVLAATSEAAIIHTESGDAGELPGTAQSTGSGELVTILGNLVSDINFHDVDMFAIEITDPSLFSATLVSGGTTVFDTYLSLFDQSGMGVVANDDVASIAPLSMIPVGFVGSPGLYFLAISEFPNLPLSASGFIFPDTTADPNQVVTNTGPGGLNPIFGWDKPDGQPQFGGSYEILLAGAEGAQLQAVVPEPSSLTAMSLLFSLAAMRLGFKRRRFD